MKPSIQAADAGWPPALLRAGARGAHLLFEAAVIRQAFEHVEHAGLRQRGLLGAHDALRRLGGLEGLEERRRLIEELEEETKDHLVFLYFRVLDQFLSEGKQTIH